MRGIGIGRVMARPNLVTPAGVRQEYPIHHIPAHLKWPRKSVKGLTYVVMDKGPLQQWLKRIGRADNNLCIYGQVQNAAHVMRCTEIGNEKGWTLEEAYKDSEWCGAVVDFLML